MLIELITPLLIATAPTTVIVPDAAKYDHKTQVVARLDTEEVLQLTFGGTRTYDFNGRPWDNDND